MTRQSKLDSLDYFPPHKADYKCWDCMKNKYNSPYVEVNGCYVCLKCFMRGDE